MTVCMHCGGKTKSNGQCRTCATSGRVANDPGEPPRQRRFPVPGKKPTVRIPGKGKPPGRTNSGGRAQAP